MKCLSNGLNYPYYRLQAWIWEKDPNKENGGEYNTHTLMETESFNEAFSTFSAVKLSVTRPEVQLFREDEEDCVWIGTRDESGFYDT